MNASRLLFAAATLAVLSLLSAPAARAQQFPLYVGDEGSSAIEQYDSAGNGTGFAVGHGLLSPRGLAFDGAGNLFVANYNGNNIREFANIGGTLSSSSTVFAGGLSSPHSLAFDSAGNLFVTNAFNSTIVEFAKTGGVLNPVPTVFAAGGGLSNPEDLAFDRAGNLYVTEPNITTIQVFSPSGVGTVFTNTAQNGPHGLAFDGAGDLFTAYGGTIEEFAFTGGSLSHSATAFSGSGLFGPEGLAFDSAGNLFAAYPSSNSIRKFANVGGTLNSTSTLFSNRGVALPTSLAFTPAPEPSSVAAFACTGLLAAGLMWKARKRA